MVLETDPLDIPGFLRRDINNESEITKMVDSTVEQEVSRPAKSVVKAKPNGAAKAPTKAAGKAKAVKAAATPAKAKTAPKAPVKAAKPKAAKAEVLAKDAFGFRKGSAKSEAAAMYARKSGATLEEVKAKVGSIQLNCLVTLEGEGYMVEKKKETREGMRPVTRYFLKPKA